MRAPAPTSEPTHAKVRRHRDRLRAQGLRPLQIWVPDTRAPGFAAEAWRQARSVAASGHEATDQDFVDAIAEETGAEKV